MAGRLNGGQSEEGSNVKCMKMRKRKISVIPSATQAKLGINNVHRIFEQLSGFLTPKSYDVGKAARQLEQGAPTIASATPSYAGFLV